MPHIPVHLGAMGETIVPCFVRGHELAPDSIGLRDPYSGGSHLLTSR